MNYSVEDKYPHRIFWKSDEINNSEAGYGYELDERPTSEENANLIGSRTLNGKHGPIIDLDFPCRLVESTTPGHFHLYLDKEVEFNAYLKVLEAMRDAGLVQQGFVEGMYQRGQTFVRVNEPKPANFEYKIDNKRRF